MADNKTAKMVTTSSVRVLQDITIKNSNSSAEVLPPQTNGYEGPQNKGKRSDDQNFNKQNLTRRRITASFLIFGEEPVFSDSDEESEYCKKIMVAHKSLKSTNTPPVESNHTSTSYSNLTPDELQVIDIIKKGSEINLENVNEDFKQFINSCKNLFCKYQNFALSEKKLPVAASTNDKSSTTDEEINIKQTEIISSNKNTSSQSPAKEIESKATKTVFGHENIEEMPLSSIENQPCSYQFRPSRSGSSGDTGIFSEKFSSFNSDLSKIGSIIRKIDDDEEAKEKTFTRSGRISKPVRRDNGGALITNIRKYKLYMKKQMQENNNNSNKEKTKSPSGNKIIDKTKQQIKSPVRESLLLINCRKSSTNNPNCKRTGKSLYTRKEIRSLARNWMNTNKTVTNEQNSSATTNQSFPLSKRKVRHLYSPEEWLESEEMNNLRNACDKEHTYNISKTFL